MEVRTVEGVGNQNPNYFFNFVDCYITSRIDVRPIVRPGLRGTLCYYEKMQINDIFVTDLLQFKPGKYRLAIKCMTTPFSGEVTFRLDGNIIGVIDFYSEFDQETVVLIEDITITRFLYQSIEFTVTRKTPNSLGYNLMLGDFTLTFQK